MRSIAIFGVGLIGGSFGLALRANGFKGRILGVSSARTLETALELGAITEAATFERALEADLIYLAQPIFAIAETLERLAGRVRPDCLITDAGSTKSELVSKAHSLGLSEQFLGGHPMAGKESRGVGAADPQLFRGRPYVFTPLAPEMMNTPLAGELVAAVSKFGALPVVMEAAEHDRTVAFTSHLPQLLSTALASTLSRQVDEDITFKVSGPGLHDMTRLGASAWDIWADIVRSNTDFIDHALGVYIDKLTEMRNNLQTQQLGEEFSVAGAMAARLRRCGVVAKKTKEG